MAKAQQATIQQQQQQMQMQQGAFAAQQAAMATAAVVPGAPAGPQFTFGQNPQSPKGNDAFNFLKSGF